MTTKTKTDGTKVLAADAGLTIEDDWKSLCPPLSKPERDQLEANLLKEGCRDSIKATPGGKLLDGHNRLEFCEKHNIPFLVERIEVADDDEAKRWIINNQLGRRNLSRVFSTYLMGRLYNSEKANHGGDRKGGDYQVITNEDLKKSSDSNDLKTSEKVGKRIGVSKSTIERAGRFAKHLDSLEFTAKDNILSGEVSIAIDDMKRFAGLKPREQLGLCHTAMKEHSGQIAFPKPKRISEAQRSPLHRKPKAPAPPAAEVDDDADDFEIEYDSLDVDEQNGTPEPTEDSEPTSEPREQSPQQKASHELKRGRQALGVIVRVLDDFGACDRFQKHLEPIAQWFEDSKGKKLMADAREAVGAET